MFLPNILITAYSEGFSGIYVQCPNPDEVSKEFLSAFDTAYRQAMDDLEEEMGVMVSEKYDDLPCPAKIETVEDSQFLIRLAPLFLNLNDGTRADNDYLLHALVNVLDGLQEKFTNVSYYGLIAYEWFDEHCGDVVSVEIKATNCMLENPSYPFVKDIFDEIFADEESSEEFWELLEDNLFDCTEEDIRAVMECFTEYDQPEEVFNKFQNIVDNYDFDE